jgi:PEP-CTERM motif
VVPGVEASYTLPSNRKPYSLNPLIYQENFGWHASRLIHSLPLAPPRKELKMKKSILLRGAQVAIAAAALAAASIATAATWNLSNGGASGANSTTANVSGFYVNNNSTGVINSGSTFTSQALADHGSYGMGMYSGTDSGEPQHALDNNGTTEMISVQFGARVDLDSVNVSWAGADSDLSVLAYTGSSAPASIAGRTWNQLVSSGWSLIGHYAGSAGQTGTRSINAGNVTSSWWLISAFNSGFGGNTSGLNNHNDYVKLLSVAGSAVSGCPSGGGSSGGGSSGGGSACGGQQVAEPAALALFGLAALGVVAVRRRNAS